MEPQTYSIEELLQLRDTVSRAIPRRLRNNSEIVDIVKDPAITMSEENHSLKKVHEDGSSSTESDEIVFQGKKSRRAQWDYRGRTASEVTPKEPLCAPAEPKAQQSEGFQKFFKAVSSPTHIRVTAGGKIVPNTRGSVSPTAKWDKEHSAVGGQGSSETISNEKPEASNGIGSQGPHPLISPLYPGHPAYFQHMGVPMPIYPMAPPGIPMAYGMPHPPFIHPGIKLPQPIQSQQDTEEPVKDVKTQDGAGDKKPRPVPIKVVPRDQFEQNRPFYSNGNVIYPAPYGPGPGPGPNHMPMMVPPYLAPGMIGSPAFASPHAGSMGSMGQLSPAASNLVMPSPRFVGPPGMSGGPHPLHPPPALMAQHITSIRPSEITRRQLDSLRDSLKYHEDQLQYNKHQIDESWASQQVEQLRNSVRQFEETYQVQINHEALHYPPPGSASGSAQQGPPWKTPSGPSSVKSRREVNTSENGSISASERSRLILHLQSLSKSEKVLKPAGLNSNKDANFRPSSNHGLESLLHDKGKKGPTVSDLSKNVKLTPNATMAPVFEAGTRSEGPGPRALVGPPGTYGFGAWLPAGMLPVNQQGSWKGAYPTNMYAANTTTIGQPYLVGTLPQGVDPRGARVVDYAYARELTEEEKQARTLYWGQVPNGGLGLPKFDGKDFYPPSPVKAARTAEGASRSAARRAIPSGRPALDFGFQAKPIQPNSFGSSHATQGAQPQESTQKISKAIPIVAPEDASRRSESKVANTLASRGDEGEQNIGQMMEHTNISSPTKSPNDSAATNMQSMATRRMLERSSNKSGNELWQTMLKKGSTSGIALPSTISSTTATGLLPQYHGHAAASLNPSMAKGTEQDSQVPAEKVGENRPPNGTRSEDCDPLSDSQERKLRRGVLSDW